MYLTRNQAGVYSASGVRIPPSPPDKEKGLPNGSPFSLSGAGHDALCARRPTRCCATRGPLPLPASPRPCRGSPSTEGLVPPDCLRESTPCVDAHRDLRRSDHVLIRRGTRRALRASPHTLLCNAWAPPFAGLSPPLSGQPLNRGACFSRCIRRSTLCVDGQRELRCSDHVLIWRGTRRALRVAPNVAVQRSGPSLCRPLPAPVGAAPQQRGLFQQMHQ